MSTAQITTEIHVNLRTEYALNDRFAPNTKITLIEWDSYLRLLELLTPEQHAQIGELAQNDDFHAIAGYVEFTI
jgi:hypothetical protein